MPPTAKMRRPIAVRVRYSPPTTATASIASIGTGYTVPSPSLAFATAVREGGTRMLSALDTTNATPRYTHIVPSVMMNGWTPRRHTMTPLSKPQPKPTPTQIARAAHGASADSLPRSTSAMVTPASA